MNEFQIIYRAARPVDADQVHRLMSTVAEEEGVLIEAPKEISAEDIRVRIRNSTNRRNRLFLVAAEDERIVGMAALETGPLDALAHIRILTLMVEHHHRRRGIGRELARQAMEWARRTPGVHKIEVQVREANNPGLRLVLSLGFTLEGKLRRHVQVAGAREIDDLLLALFVDDPVAAEKVE
jgi:RimJ/RimL family protein N-acetyltransferase